MAPMRHAVGLGLAIAVLMAAASLALVSPPIARAQSDAPPPIGTIDYYGLTTISSDEVAPLLPFAVGDTLSELTEPAQPEAIARALGVERVELSYVCCTDDGLFQIYVGVQERPGQTVDYLAPPTGDARLPDEMVADFDAFLDALVEAVLSGQSSEDRSEGHALSEYPPMRRRQERFSVYAENQSARLVQVLRESADAKHRAAAANILGYAPDKAAVVPVLAAAALDPDDDVRNYATRALAVIAEYANAHPELRIDIPAEPFIAMLSSIVWSDRNKGLAVMAPLTTDRDPALLARLQADSLDSLMEMCRWQHWGHAAPACLILQRAIGLPDDARERSRSATLARAAELTPKSIENPR